MPKIVYIEKEMCSLKIFQQPVAIFIPFPHFFWASLLITWVMSTGPLAASLAFCASSCCLKMMGLRLGLRFLAFCSSWVSLRKEKILCYDIRTRQLVQTLFQFKKILFLMLWALKPTWICAVQEQQPFSVCL